MAYHQSPFATTGEFTDELTNNNTDKTICGEAMDDKYNSTNVGRCCRHTCINNNIYLSCKNIVSIDGKKKESLYFKLLPIEKSGKGKGFMMMLIGKIKLDKSF